MTPLLRHLMELPSLLQWIGGGCLALAALIAILGWLFPGEPEASTAVVEMTEADREMARRVRLDLASRTGTDPVRRQDARDAVNTSTRGALGL